MSPPPPLDCVEAERRLRRHLHEALPTARARELREHLAGCADCDALYRELADTTAVLGRASRERRALARDARAELAGRAPDPKALRDQRRNRTRILIYPALLALVLIGLGRRLPLRQGARVEALVGDVRLSGEPLPGGEDATLGVGRAVETGPDGAARLRAGDAELRLGPSGRLRVERLVPLSVEVVSGAAELVGPLTLRSPHGVLELEDGARATATVDARTRVEVREGAARLLDASGARDLRSGDAGELPLGP